MTTSAAVAVDLISEFNDDVLLHIVSFLPSARDAARTSVLSKRWRHLWSIAPCLRFTVGPGTTDDVDDGEDEDEEAADGRHHAARRLIAAVDASLARRAAATEGNNDVDDLEISLVYSSPRSRAYRSRFWGWYHDRHRHAADVTSSRVAAWLGFAARHVKHNFAVEVPDNYDELYFEEERVLLAELPRSARAESMRLTLGCATLAVPTVGAGAFSALTDFHLSHIQLDATAGDDDELRLGLLLSSPCCPRLRRLTLKHVAGLTALCLDDVAALEELRLAYLPDLLQLNVDAPGLRLLRVGHCNLHLSRASTVRISAPRLEVLACDRLVHPSRLRLDGIAAVRRIKKLVLLSFYFYHSQRDAAAVWILKNCTAVDHLELELSIDVCIGVKDIIKDVPNLSTVTNLKVTACTGMKRHTMAYSLARFIAKCNRIEYLSINIKGGRGTNNFCICDGPEGWEDQMISMEHLRMVEIHGFEPLDDHISLVQLLLTCSPDLETLTMELDDDYVLKSKKEGKLIDFYIPRYEGSWAPSDWGHGEDEFSGATKYKWTREKENRGTR